MKRTFIIVAGAVWTLAALTIAVSQDKDNSGTAGEDRQGAKLASPAGSGFPTGYPVNLERYVLSNQIMITWSEGNESAWGFSKSLGKWAKQEINPPAKESPFISRTLVVGDSVGVWRVGSSYYAYSGKTGSWDVLRLPEGRTPTPAVDDELIIVHDKDDDYTFAAATGQWTSPKDSESVAASKTEESQIKVFQLRNAKAIDAERLVSQLFPRDIQSVAADQRTNSLIVRGSEETLNIIYHILTRLDEQTESAPSAPAARDSRQQAAASASIEKLRAQYQSEERKAADLARQIRELQVAPDDHKLAIDELKTKLRRAVADAFAARQQLQQAEAAQLQQRVAGIQKNLETRQKLSERIIDNRVKDLLDPEILWEWGDGGSPRLVGQAPRLPAPPAIPSPSLPNSFKTTPPITAPPNFPAARAYRNKLGERFNQVNELFRVGRVPLSDVLQAAAEFAQAELDASANAEERVAARRQAVDRLKAIKSIIDPKVEQHVEPSQSKLAVDAALIKAEAELAAEVSDKASLESVPVHWTSRQTSQIIWNVLGVRVQEIVPQSAAKFGYKGGLLVDEVRTALEPSDLREGDIILGLHHWETKSADELAWVIMQPISRNVAVLNPRDRTSPETAVIHILRDGELLRYEVKLPPPMVDLMRTNFPRGWESISATTSPQANSTSAAGTPTPSSTISVSALGNTTTLRSPDDFRRALASQEAAIARTKTESLSRFGGATESEQTAARQRMLDRAERDLAFLREEYAAQLRLLELEVQDASAAVSAAAEQQKLVRDKHSAGRTTPDQVIATERAVQEANTRFQRAKTLLDLYRKADPKNGEAASNPSEAPKELPKAKQE